MSPPSVSEVALLTLVRRLALDSSKDSKISKKIGWLDLSIVIPLVTAIVAGLIGFVSSAYVGYLNNKGTIALEHEREQGQLTIENHKSQTNLILEAVKTRDRKKALENLTFFLDAGFIDDPDGRIKSLIGRDILPVLPTNKEVEKLSKDYGISREAMTNLLNIINDKGIPPEQARDKLKEMVTRYTELRDTMSHLSASNEAEELENNWIQDAVNAGNLQLAEKMLQHRSDEKMKEFEAAQKNSDQARKELARLSVTEGNDAIKNGNFQQAESLYERAIKLFRHDDSDVASTKQKLDEVRKRLTKPPGQ
jgi:hypothetical protein